MAKPTCQPSLRPFAYPIVVPLHPNERENSKSTLSCPQRRVASQRRAGEGGITKDVCVGVLEELDVVLHAAVSAV